MKSTLHVALLHFASVLSLFACGACAAAEPLKSLTVCADPGNMPLSNDKREGFENKIAEVIGKSLNIPVQYYWRPSIERGLMRTTLSEGNCDLWMDMATDTEGAITTVPLYRSTFVFAYRNDKGYHFESFSDKQLQKLRIGVFQVSAIRQAMAPWGIMANTVVHYLSHNGDLVAENQPSYQVQQVIDGALDIAAAWGPMAGYYVTKLHQPVTVQPVNLFPGDVPLEFDMALAVPRGRPDVKTAIEDTMRKEKDQIQAILTDYGVPLVKCDDCVVSGNLPSHGPYKKADANTTASAPPPIHTSSMPELKEALAHGAKPEEELANAVVADDAERVHYLLGHGARIDARFLDGMTALTNSTRFGFTDLVTALIAAKADPNATDLSGWTPLMYAAWIDDPDVVKQLVKAGAKLEFADDNGLTALGVAAQNGKAKALEALIASGADANKTVGKAGYTPLMLASISGSEDIASFLIAHGADVNAKNAGGVTALMVAAANNTARIGSLLLKSGADPSVKSDDGRTAKTIAETNNSQAMLQLLQTSGAQGKTSGS